MACGKVFDTSCMEPSNHEVKVTIKEIIVPEDLILFLPQLFTIVLIYYSVINKLVHMSAIIILCNG